MKRQRGFALLELALAVLIAMLAAVFTVDRFAERSREVMAEGHAAWMMALHHAVLRYVEQHGATLAAQGGAGPVAGFVDALVPTQAELKAAGFLAAGYPEQGTRGVGAGIRLLPRGDCPSDSCHIEALVYSDAPLGQDHARTHNLAMVAHWLSVSAGRGGAVMPHRTHLVGGPAFSFSNPPVAGMARLPPGTVAMAVTAEQLQNLPYLRVGDSRDPDFQGAASVAGNVRTQGALSAREHLFIEAQAYALTACAPEGAIVRERFGGLLVCRGATWRSAGGMGGGGYSINNLSGCVAAAANPVTGDCSCPADYVPVRIADSTSAVPAEGRTRGYLCVG